MTKKIILICAMLFSPLAFAVDTDFAAIADADAESFVRPKKMHRCMRKAWKSTNPSAEQTEQAKGYLAAARAVMEEHKPAIMEAMQGLKAAWMKHPISKEEVASAGRVLHDHVVPVKTAVRDAGIDALNLLSAEQRTTFNTTFGTCIQKKKNRN